MSLIDGIETICVYWPAIRLARLYLSFCRSSRGLSVSGSKDENCHRRPAMDTASAVSATHGRSFRRGIQCHIHLTGSKPITTAKRQVAACFQQRAWMAVSVPGAAVETPMARDLWDVLSEQTPRLIPLQCSGLMMSVGH